MSSSKEAAPSPSKSVRMAITIPTDNETSTPTARGSSTKSPSRLNRVTTPSNYASKSPMSGRATTPKNRQAQIGTMFQEGECKFLSKKNRVHSHTFYREVDKATREDNVTALYYRVLNGDFGAEQLLIDDAKNDGALADAYLATLYWHGYGRIKENHAKARFHHSDFLRHYNGKECPPQYRVDEWLVDEADKSNRYVEFCLGKCYLDGIGKFKLDHDKAFLLLQSSASKDFTPAMADLGDCYYYGMGCKEDIFAARDEYERGLKWAIPSAPLI